MYAERQPLHAGPEGTLGSNLGGSPGAMEHWGLSIFFRCEVEKSWGTGDS